MIQQSALTAQDIRETMQSVCQEHLPLEANGGYTCTSEMFYDVLMKAASENISIDAACRDLERSASGNRIREVLNEQLSIEHLHEYERQVNEALAARLPQQLLSRRVEAAIDEHDEPCYAKTPELRAYTCRSKPKAGTSSFLRIISLYVIYRQMRLTLAVAFVRPEEKLVGVIQRALTTALDGADAYAPHHLIGLWDVAHAEAALDGSLKSGYLAALSSKLDEAIGAGDTEAIGDIAAFASDYGYADMQSKAEAALG